MSWVVPTALEDAVHEATRRVVSEAPLATGALARAIVDRSQRYTSERDRLAQPADKRADLAARAAFFTIADAMKIAIPVGELAGRGALPASEPLRVLDLGAGCGAMSLGLAAVLDRRLDIVAIDRDGDALAIAAGAMRAFAGARVTMTTRIDHVGKVTLPAADLVVMGTLLNELPADVALSLVERALAVVGDHGAVIVVEPALRDTSRRLHELRDAIIARGKGHVFAPCTRRGAPCPALANPADWCHEDRALVLPPRTAELARLTHLRDSGMKFSYLVLRNRPLALVEVGGDARAWRIVSASRIAKGKHEVFGCSEHGRTTLRLLKRNRSPENRDFERADRGDVAITASEPGDDRVELSGPVEIRSPAK